MKQLKIIVEKHPDGYISSKRLSLKAALPIDWEGISG